MSHHSFLHLLWLGALAMGCSSSTNTGFAGSLGSKTGGSGCTSNAECASGLCLAGVCQSGQPGGASCTSGSACVSGACQGSVCSGNGSGAPPGGTCTGNDQCASRACANGTCSPGSGLPDGKSCASADECVSNACTNGICGSGTSGGAGGATGSSGGGDSGSGACSSSSALVAAAGGATTGSAPPVTCNPDAGDAPDQTGCSCTPGTSRACFNGAPGTRGVGACRDGTQVCLSEGELTGTFDVCTGAVTVCTPPAPPALCTDTTVNNEPEILAGYSPATGQTVAKNGQIKVWVTDEWPPFISQGEVVDPSTGAVLTPGDRAGKAPDGYLFEPALYIAPETAESGGTPHFPQWIKGQYNNNPAAGKPMGGKGGPKGGTGTPPTIVQGAPVDAPPAGTSLTDKYSDEYVWDVCALGLPPGTYNAEFVIIDGDQDRAVGCVTIVIAP